MDVLQSETYENDESLVVLLFRKAESHESLTSSNWLNSCFRHCPLSILPITEILCVLCLFCVCFVCFREEILCEFCVCFVCVSLLTSSNWLNSCFRHYPLSIAVNYSVHCWGQDWSIWTIFFVKCKLGSREKNLVHFREQLFQTLSPINCQLSPINCPLSIANHRNHEQQQEQVPMCNQEKKIHSNLIISKDFSEMFWTNIQDQL